MRFTIGLHVSQTLTTQISRRFLALCTSCNHVPNLPCNSYQHNSLTPLVIYYDEVYLIGLCVKHLPHKFPAGSSPCAQAVTTSPISPVIRISIILSPRVPFTMSISPMRFVIGILKAASSGVTSDVSSLQKNNKMTH